MERYKKHFLNILYLSSVYQCGYFPMSRWQEPPCQFYQCSIQTMKMKGTWFSIETCCYTRCATQEGKHGSFSSVFMQLKNCRWELASTQALPKWNRYMYFSSIWLWILEKSKLSPSENFANSENENTFSSLASLSVMQKNHCQIRAIRGEKRAPNSDCTYSVHCCGYLLIYF